MSLGAVLRVGTAHWAGTVEQVGSGNNLVGGGAAIWMDRSGYAQKRRGGLEFGK